ncbi:sensor histidine kinase [Gordonia soli]|uniref:histidine kinase n=1 Tax=Gordonia soli NBRC 108243 TaxID=1223545 RepID=M0QMI3_9ACTN|nr:histidine kinase [Gordonia soli]GAC69634.1 putative two-component histidine kinase [Gordonia soli NBRC 108243]
MQPEDYQPPLTWWSHVWRLVVMLAISGISWGTRIDYQWDHARWWFFTDLALGLVTYAAIWWRRSHPVALATLTNLTSIVSASSGGPAALAMVSLSTRRRWGEILPQVVLGALCSVLAEQFFRTPQESEPMLVRYSVVIATIGITVSWGMYVGSRRELLASWRARAMASEAEQQAKVREAKSLERARIAREMHDVLAHRISAVSMYAGALAYRDDLTPAQLRETATTIQENAHLALTELREVLGVLREGPGDADPERPQLGVGDLDALIEESRQTGVRVELVRSVDLAAVTPTIGRTLYRCVQEALTNARKHAPGTTVSVRITGGPEQGIDLLVENPLPVGGHRASFPVSGLGLVGLAERVALNGGRQSYTRTDDRRFVLHVWLPWQS